MQSYIFTYFFTTLYMAGMTDNHIYKLEPLPQDRTRFVQTDQLAGGLSHVIGTHMARGMMHAYVEFNRALRARVEAML